LKEVFIYVEGPSDKLGLEKLFKGIDELAMSKGNKVVFTSMGGKTPLLNKTPGRAINILRNKHNSHVFLLPDLYPQNTPFSHETFHQLKQGLLERFNHQLKRLRLPEQLKDRFHIHCFKYDFESLVLASESPLLKRLDVREFPTTWVKPVENQNHGKPPKRIVEDMFRKCKKKYKDTIDAPWILERSDYKYLMEACPQQFKPFVKDLLTVLELKES